MSNHTVIHPRLAVEVTGTSIVSNAGAVLLLRTADKIGLTSGLSTALAPWRKPFTVHDPGKTVLDLAVAVALGGDCLADIAVLREQSAVFGPVASDPTVSRTITELARNPQKALRAIDQATAAARSAAWSLAGTAAPDHDTDAGSPLVIDIDATLVTSHSEKEQAAPTYKKGFGFHPLLAFIDHGADGGGEPVAGILRPGNAGANTAADHIPVINSALAQLPGPGRYRVGKKVLIRMDGAGGTKTTLEHCVKRGLSYSAGFTLTEPLAALIDKIPAAGWTPAYNADGRPRDGAWVVELTHMADLTGWPDGMRLIVRKERPHPGAQLRITDRDGHRLTAFVTNTRGGQLADLELRHRQRARCEDRIRAGKQTGLAGFPFKHFAQNQPQDFMRPEPPTIRLSPREGHPSSLWPSAELLLVQPDSPYSVLPVHLGIDSVLGESILAWSAAFQNDFMDDSYDFESRPTWRPGSSALDWYDEGMHLLKELRDFFPDVQIRPEFAHRVFSVNERREALGKLPLCLPEESRTGYVSVSAAREV